MDAKKPYFPLRKKSRPRIDRTTQKPLSAYLSTPEYAELYDEWMDYLERHELTPTEWARWMAAKCVEEDLAPPEVE